MHKNFENGRSMIEMLGVLAIIAVLSVGGIAGYSKAMLMWKMNKEIEGYNYLFFSLFEHIDIFRKVSNQTLMGNVVLDINAVPENWIYKNGMLYDPAGNTIIVMGRSGVLVFDIRLGSNLKQSQSKCFEIYKNFIQPLHEVVKDSWIHNVRGGYTVFYGDKYCDGKYRVKCLKNMNLQNIRQICNSCPFNEQNCPIAVEF